MRPPPACACTPVVRLCDAHHVLAWDYGCGPAAAAGAAWAEKRWRRVAPIERLNPWPSLGEVIGEAKRRIAELSHCDKRLLNAFAKLAWDNADSRWRSLQAEARQKAHLMSKRLDR